VQTDGQVGVVPLPVEPLQQGYNPLKCTDCSLVVPLPVLGVSFLVHPHRFALQLLALLGRQFLLLAPRECGEEQQQRQQRNTREPSANTDGKHGSPPSVGCRLPASSPWKAKQTARVYGNSRRSGARSSRCVRTTGSSCSPPCPIRTGPLRGR